MTADHFLGRLSEVARRQPDALAVDAGPAGRLTCAGLYARAAGLGEALRAAGAGPETIVGLYLSKSPEYLIALLGTWFARAAFLPLDPGLPAERLAFLARHARPALVIGEGDIPPALAGLGVRVLSIPADLAEAGPLPPPPDCEEGDLAYVIYTSGSTGHPKGVMVEHRGIVNLLDAQIPAFRIGPGSRSLFFLSTAFDASVSDIGTALLSGATLCLAREDEMRPGPGLARLLGRLGITHLDFPPSLLPLLDPDDLPGCLETLVIGGEPCPPGLVRAWARRVRVVNVYGPTEATVCTSLCGCDPDTWDEPLLGRPIPNTTYEILDDEFRPVPPAVPGELFIGGIGLARGYIGRPGLTARKFLSLDGRRLYRTGDRVRRRADGEVVFLGRVDRQVKVRGLLIEPEEVEARLREHPAVGQAAVVKRAGPGDGCEGLVALVVPRGDAPAPSVTALRDHLAKSLPRWMLPRQFVFRDDLPRTAAGKIDLETLSTCEILETGGVKDAPADLPEKARLLVRIWEEALGVEGVGPGDDFHELGGDSFAALRVVMSLEAHGLLVPPALFARRCTIADLLAWLPSATPAGAMSAAALRRDVERELEALGGSLPVSTSRHPPRVIFLTGGTGFLGSRLLAELLRRTGAEVKCLVRARDAGGGKARILDAIGKHGVCLDAGQERRVLPVVGDLERERFGLSAREWEALAGEVDTIHHCGARVHMVLPYEELRPANVLGTREVLRLARTGRAKSLHHVSTLSVFVASDQNAGLLEEEDGLQETRWVYGGYAQSKWAAEWLVRAAGASPLAVYRLGLITRDARTGYGGPADFLGLFLRGLRLLGCLPEGEDVDGLRVDVTPVDHAAAALAHLSLLPSASGPATYHIANPRPLALGELVEALGSFGIAIESVGAEEWRQRVQAARHRPEVSAAYLALCRCLGGGEAFERYRTMDLFQTTGVTFGMGHTRAGLAGSGIVCPPASRELLHRYFGYIFSGEDAKPQAAGREG